MQNSRHMHKFETLPLGGLGRFKALFRKTDKNILVSCAVPSQPAHAKMNCMSKLHAAITFWVGVPFLPIYGTWSPGDIVAWTCTPYNLIHKTKQEVSYLVFLPLSGAYI